MFRSAWALRDGPRFEVGIARQSERACSQRGVLVAQELEKLVEEADQLGVLPDSGDVSVAQDGGEETFRVLGISCDVGGFDPQWFRRLRLGQSVHGVTQGGERLVTPLGIRSHPVQRRERRPKVFGGLVESHAL